jgi:hypothetical protein
VKLATRQVQGQPGDPQQALSKVVIVEIPRDKRFSPIFSLCSDSGIKNSLQSHTISPGGRNNKRKNNEGEKRNKGRCAYEIASRSTRLDLSEE